ncbi:hypothetical protein [Amycolatopsis sp. cmx-4-54]|uniref:hypothetical protein n=1 Tax=Amycolatopsis sp. cmx-4-54 TaxID=2790936 RepID=UPI00397D8EC5
MKEEVSAFFGWMLVGFAVIGVASCAPHGAPLPSRSPISRAEAENLLNQAIDLAQEKNYDRLCQVVAAAEQNCRNQLEGAARSRQQPGLERPKVVAFSHFDEEGGPTAVLRLEGHRADDAAYTSDFAVIRTEGSKLGSLTAPYWIGSKYVGIGQPPPVTSTSNSSG